MTLRVEFVNKLSDVITPVAKFLSQPCDIFETQHIVVPTAGVKAWLMPELAKCLGVSSSEAQDGIIANIDFDYPGSLTKFIYPTRLGSIDKWSIENLTFEILKIIVGDLKYEQVISLAGGPLLAARTIADRFDRYHMRRPAMIREWEKGILVLSPTANDEVLDGNRLMQQLDAGDSWQFALWRAVREQIGEPSPPARPQTISAQLPKQIMVVGFQSLSPSQIDALRILQVSVDIHVLLVHPSPAIQKKWSVSVLPTPGLVPQRDVSAEIPADIDQLVHSWLRGTYELEALLASQGIAAKRIECANASQLTLLGRMQDVVTTALVATPLGFDRLDHSVAIHRCHNIGRQVEVLHETLMHAFGELKGLLPHEVVILCPNIRVAAPYLEAIFDRTIETDAGMVKLPLVVADRGLRQVSDGAELMANLLSVVQSRCSIEGIMSIAESPLVTKHLRVDESGVSAWVNYIEQAKIRWGLTSTHRAQHGLAIADLDAHTWREGLERILLGAIVPDDIATIDTMGVAAVKDADLADIDHISALICVFNAVLTLSNTIEALHTVVEWCDRIEETVVALCGENSDDLDMPMMQLAIMRSAGQNSESVVPFKDVAQILIEVLGAVPGRQPLRTGAITATSMIPLRGVPFRVVCVLGFDEDSLPVGDSEGDDLIDRQRLIGDQDARLDVRRSLLDALLAAQDRLIITCTGRSIKNNAKLPLATPLAEFVNFAERCGVQTDKETKTSDIEIVHPRHVTSVKNFIVGDVLPGQIWSHDPIAKQAAQNLGNPIVLPVVAKNAKQPNPILDMSNLELAYCNPFDLYLRHNLGIYTWRDNEAATPATLPLVLPKKEMTDLAVELLTYLSVNQGADAIKQWRVDVRARGLLPIGVFGDMQLEEVETLITAVLDQLSSKSLNYSNFKDLAVDYISSKSAQVAGRIQGCSADAAITTAVILRKTPTTEYDYKPMLQKLAIRLLVAKASGLPVQSGYVIARHEKWPKEPNKVFRERTVVLSSSIDQEEAARRVATLCEMTQIALANPCPSFNRAALELPADGKKTFENFVAGDEFDASDEAIVFGPNPMYEEIFHKTSPVSNFWNMHDQLLTLPERDNKDEYVIS